MAKYVRYKLKLKAKEPIISQALEGRIPPQVSQLSQARAIRRALRTLFRDDAELEITSVSAQGARVRRV